MIDQGTTTSLSHMAGCVILVFIFTSLVACGAHAEASSGQLAWKFRSDLNNSGVYDDGGTRPEGALLWNYTTGGRVSSSPAVAKGVVYIGSQDRNLYAFNASDGSLIWKYNTSEPFDLVSSSPAVKDGIVYIGGLKTKIHALDASTGTLLWNYTVPALQTARIEVSSSPSVANGVVYVGSFDGNLYALDAVTGTFLWNFTAFSDWNGPFSSPAVANGVVYFGSRDNNLYALDATTGDLLWNYTAGGWIDSSPAVKDDVVYFGSRDNHLYALDTTTGGLLWNYTTMGIVSSSPSVAGGVVYVGSRDNNLYALDELTGALKWSYSTGGNVSSSPAVANGVVYIGSLDKNLYALDAGTGALLWNYTTGDGIYSSPAVADGVVYVGSRDGNFYAFGPVTAPVANFTANPTSGFAPMTVQFTDTSTGSRPLTHQWDFGDGTANSTEQNPVHTYEDGGSYNVSLTVSNSAGTGTLQRPGYISVRTVPGSGKAYYLVHSNVDGAAVYFNGEFFEGTIRNGTLLVQTCPSCTPVWSFTVKKCGYFTLTQNNTHFPGRDETVDLYANLTAPREPLIADFTANVTNGTAPLAVAFANHSIGIVETVNWSFGDGTYSDARNPVHTYTDPGSYTVSLFEANSACQNDTAVKTDYITVTARPRPAFSADFSVSPTTGSAPLTVHFTDNSTGNPTWFIYNFGDGVKILARNPTHTYLLPGTYSVTLTILKYNTSSNSLMSASTTKANVITAGTSPSTGLAAEFTASPTRGLPPLTVAFTDQSTGNPTLYSYNFGDGFSSSERNPVHTYRFPGVYSVTETVLKISPGTGSIAGNSTVQENLIQVGDARGNGTWTFVVLGDSPDGQSDSPTGVSPDLPAIARAVAAEQPDLVVFTGDLVSGYLLGNQSPVEKDYPAQFENWMAAMNPVHNYSDGSGIPVYVLRGNREDPPENGTQAIDAYLSMPASGMPANGPPGEEKLTYSFFHKGAKFIVADEYTAHDGKKETVNQDWVDEQLTADTRPFMFVFGHSPAYLVDDDLPDLLNSLPVHPEERDTFWRSLVNARVPAYLCAHAHVYVRGESGGIHQIVSGNAGAPPQAFSPADADPMLTVEYPLQNVSLQDQRVGYLVIVVNETSGTWSGREKQFDKTTGTWLTGDTFTLPSRSEI